MTASAGSSPPTVLLLASIVPIMWVCFYSSSIPSFPSPQGPCHGCSFAWNALLDILVADWLTTFKPSQGAHPEHLLRSTAGPQLHLPHSGHSYLISLVVFSPPKHFTLLTPHATDLRIMLIVYCHLPF